MPISPRSPAPITPGAAHLQPLPPSMGEGRDGGEGEYADVPGFCKSASLDDIRKNGHVLPPGRYVGAADLDDDDLPFSQRLAILRVKLEEEFAEAEKLTATIRERIAQLVDE